MIDGVSLKRFYVMDRWFVIDILQIKLHGDVSLNFYDSINPICYEY